jgi:hypothetical protein
MQFYIAVRTQFIATPYIAVANNQEHSNEELVMYNCPWRKAIGSKYRPTKHKEVD